MEIVNLGGLVPIVHGVSIAASTFDMDSKPVGGTIEQFEELAAQCARALRNLSVNGKID